MKQADRLDAPPNDEARLLPPLEIYRMPGHLIRRMHQASQAIFDSEMAKAGCELTSVQFGALTAIAARPGLDQATLATAIVFDRVTTGGVVDRLEAKGLVRREIAKGDRRSRRLHLQPAGQVALAEAKPIVRVIQSKMLAGLSTREKATLVRLLEKALETVGNTRRVPLRVVGRET